MHKTIVTCKSPVSPLRPSAVADSFVLPRSCPANRSKLRLDVICFADNLIEPEVLFPSWGPGTYAVDCVISSWLCDIVIRLCAQRETQQTLIEATSKSFGLTIDSQHTLTIKAFRSPRQG
jgi:hypothetical protein